MDLYVKRTPRKKKANTDDMPPLTPLKESPDRGIKTEPEEESQETVRGVIYRIFPHQRLYWGGERARQYAGPNWWVINCTDSVELAPNVPEEHQIKLNVGDHDDLTPQLDNVTSTVHDQLSAGRSVLIHCAAGQNRSFTVLAAYLMRYHHWSWQQAFDHARELTAGSTALQPHPNPKAHQAPKVRAWIMRLRENRARATSPVDVEMQETTHTLELWMDVCQRNDMALWHVFAEYVKEIDVSGIAEQVVSSRTRKKLDDNTIDDLCGAISSWLESRIGEVRRWFAEGRLHAPEAEQDRARHASLRRFLVQHLDGAALTAPDLADDPWGDLVAEELARRQNIMSETEQVFPGIVADLTERPTSSMAEDLYVCHGRPVPAVAAFLKGTQSSYILVSDHEPVHQDHHVFFQASAVADALKEGNRKTMLLRLSIKKGTVQTTHFTLVRTDAKGKLGSQRYCIERSHRLVWIHTKEQYENVWTYKGTALPALSDVFRYGILAPDYFSAMQTLLLTNSASKNRGVEYDRAKMHMLIPNVLF